MTNEADVTRRLIELEQRMDLLFDHLQLDAARLADEAGQADQGDKLDASQLARKAGVLGPDVRALLDRGDKPGAITLVREQTGMGLSEARRTVEQIMGGS